MRLPRRWLACGLAAVAWALAGCSLLPTQEAGAAQPAGAASAPVAAVPAFTLEVEAPSDLRALLLRHLDLARLQTLPPGERLGQAEFNRLVAAAPAQARQLLQTEGYFRADAKVEPDPATLADAPPADAATPRRVRLRVQPGPPVRVAAVEIRPEGPLADRLAAGDAEARALRDALPGEGVLAAGDVFRNPAWQTTKQTLLTRLRSAGHAAASIRESDAAIDPEAGTARLTVVLDSGPLFRAGPLQISGLVQHDRAMVEAQAGFAAGAPLTEAMLLAYQDRLQKTRLFTMASVGFEPDLAQAEATPVRVRLAEAPLQQATVGVGISANTGPRATVEHTHRRPFGLAWVAQNKAEWGRDQQSFSADYQSHPGEGFYRWVLGAQIERTVSDTDVVLSQRLRLGRTQDTPRVERLVFAELLRSRQADLPGLGRVVGTPATASAVTANLHWVWRDLDSVLLPTRGLTLALQGGLGQAVQHNGPDGPFARLYGRITGYLPLGGRWYGNARLELGQIVRGSGIHVPDALGFRAGGDDSVRGYAWRSLAPTDATGNTVSGERLATASVELARPILASMPSLWGAVFVDAGRATNSWQGFRPAWGAGAGIRWRSPIGPLRVDLAWGEELRKLRLHFSVGIVL